MSDWILALETSSDACSIALLGPDEVHVRHQVAPRQHTELLIPMIEAVLQEAGRIAADLTLVAFGCGPGSFTGVRIAAATAQGFALARDLPLVPISSLAALAAGANRLYGQRHLLCTLDARRSEIYAGAFVLQEGVWKRCGTERVLAPADLTIPDETGNWSAVGHGWAAHAGRYAAATAALTLLDLPYPMAEDVARLARLVPPAARVVAADALPVYLRGAVD